MVCGLIGVVCNVIKGKGYTQAVLNKSTCNDIISLVMTVCQSIDIVCNLMTDSKYEPISIYKNHSMF